MGTLLTRAYTAGGCYLGAILGTGTNGAYVEDVGQNLRPYKSLRTFMPILQQKSRSMQTLLPLCGVVQWWSTQNGVHLTTP